MQLKGVHDPEQRRTCNAAVGRLRQRLEGGQTGKGTLHGHTHEFHETLLAWIAWSA